MISTDPLYPSDLRRENFQSHPLLSACFGIASSHKQRHERIREAYHAETEEKPCPRLLHFELVRTEQAHQHGLDNCRGIEPGGTVGGHPLAPKTLW